MWLRFNFKTDEAMGMNMVTVATKEMVNLIEKKLRIKCVSLSGNYCVDKKLSWLNFTEGRGKQVWAEVVVSRKIVKEVLKTTPEEIVEVVKRKQLLGSIMSGSMGFNAHYANIVSGVFLATGQDMAHVVEGSMGVTTAEIGDRNLFIQETVVNRSFQGYGSLLYRAKPVATYPGNFSKTKNRACLDSEISSKKVNSLLYFSVYYRV